MNPTQIEWVKNPDGSQGYTWNPITGCLNHVNGLCRGGGFPCYAYKLAHGRLSSRYLAGGIVANEGENHENLLDPFYPRFWEEKVDEIWNLCRGRYAKAKGIFLCDMSDLFGIGIPEDWTRTILDAVSHAKPHRFYLLTKQPQNLIKWSPFPENCWVGVTATTRASLKAGFWHLAGIQAKVKYLSLEPLLEEPPTASLFACIKGLDWLIIGQQTPVSAKTEPKIEWIKEIVSAADKAGVKVFLKNNIRPLLMPEDCPRANYLTEDIFWASEKAQLRQEMPDSEVGGHKCTTLTISK